MIASKNLASDSEFAEAAAALHAYLDARAAGAWAAACEYLATGISEQLARLSGDAGQGDTTKQPSFAQIFARLSGGLPKSVLREAAQADVASLRREGERAFLLFIGAHDTPYFIPMAREDGQWKVAAIAPSPLS